jgi:hypothetical protein
MEGVRDDLIRHGVRYILFSPGLFTFSTWVGSEGSGQPGGASIVRNLPFLPRVGPDSPKSDRPAGHDYEVQLRNWATFSMFASRFAEPVKEWRKSCTLYRIK